MVVISLGLNHKTAPVEIREKLAMSKTQIMNNTNKLKSIEGIKGIIILSTCNRTELYITSKLLDDGKQALLEFVSDYSNCSLEQLLPYIYLKHDKEAVHHLFRVSSGLDSMILGESQILGQVQDAYDYAREFKISNNILNTLFQHAITLGKRVRTETLIDRQSVSISSTAVDLAKQLFGDLEGKSVLVLGAGDTSELTVRHLVANGISSVIVANRTYDKACNLANEFGGKAIHLDDFPHHLVNADIVISCTAAPKYILNYEDVLPIAKQRKNDPILFIDIAVPRDINPKIATLENISLYDVDDLHLVIQQHLSERKKEAIKAEFIIKEEYTKFFKWLDSLTVVPTIVALKNKADAIKDKELKRALRKLGNISEKEKKAVHSLANSIVNQLLHQPIEELKECAQDIKKRNLYKETLTSMFKLDETEKNILIPSNIGEASGYEKMYKSRFP
ncbi:glutamyl-tRNA reductase [Desulfonispora thiosulfatigenes DSM 11270]|uniref:Glutamyl-tRNA reductase n=1 Tax=Desulfonispora thiosulfatigenes DSM 11270 TaxID=656914 RepID=A0A1W1VM94_DESTI|nr:glutamyl-tRNA reductase [Desulfonispora thiosulfatigenes]SMB94171.1 glutamyl-tRNA reductase [Desulfonispora thiosulfatigenes DSM 11270]